MEKSRKDLLKNESEVLNSLSNGLSADSRKNAYNKWKDTPAPTTRDEYWKYTRLGPILNKTYSIHNESKSFNTDFLRDIDAYNLVFINGVFSESHSDQISNKDCIITNLNSTEGNEAESLNSNNEHASGDYFSLLNSAFYQDGPFIWIGKNVQLDKAIHITNVCTEGEGLINSKGFVTLEEGSSVKIIETWDDDGAIKNLMNARMDYAIGVNAQCEVTKIQAVGSENSLINQEFIGQKKDSRFTINTITMQGQMIRNNVNAELLGEGSECNLNGLYMAAGQEHIDNHTKINHAVPNCNSNELYKGILNEKSKGVFNGKVIVSRDAQKTNAFQYNGNILLTNDCEVYSKPELEIYADDVKCSHGSTTGQLDEEALFYLQSRGIGKVKARNLLLQAFAGEVLDRITNEQIKTRVGKYISERYHTHG